MLDHGQAELRSLEAARHFQASGERQQLTSAGVRAANHSSNRLSCSRRLLGSQDWIRRRRSDLHAPLRGSSTLFSAQISAIIHSMNVAPKIKLKTRIAH
jgi:outer membrane translocation and assembly module TamA